LFIIDKFTRTPRRRAAAHVLELLDTKTTCQGLLGASNPTSKLVRVSERACPQHGHFTVKKQILRNSESTITLNLQSTFSVVPDTTKSKNDKLTKQIQYQIRVVKNAVF